MFTITTCHRAQSRSIFVAFRSHHVVRASAAYRHQSKVSTSMPYHAESHHSKSITSQVLTEFTLSSSLQSIFMSSFSPVVVALPSRNQRGSTRLELLFPTMYFPSTSAHPVKSGSQLCVSLSTLPTLVCVHIAKPKEAYQHIGVSCAFVNVPMFTSKLVWFMLPSLQPTTTTTFINFSPRPGSGPVFYQLKIKLSRTTDRKSVV